MSEIKTNPHVDPDDPTLINWASRQREAWIPYEVRDGRPVNPYAPTGVERGRGELWHWGEGKAVDALVRAIMDDITWIVMIERGDDLGWALPGGKVDPGETPMQAAVRELAEETGLNLAGAAWRIGAPRYVPDPRASDEAWMVTRLCTVNLGHVHKLPTVVGSDDASRAEWIRGDSFEHLVNDLDEHYDNPQVFAAHEDMLRDALDGGTVEWVHAIPPA